MEIKFTTDGKKVVVIGNLNSQEKIVQEVFIVNGVEIPSGENFVVKSLHDAPAISWKEKALKDLEENYNSLSKKYKTDIDSLIKKLRNESSVLNHQINSLCSLKKKSVKEDFKRIIDFISGKIEYVVKDNYDGVEIVPFNKAIEQREDYDYSKIKLCTVYGRSDGDIQFNINTYSDGSGGNVRIYPFNSYDDAYKFACDLLITKFNDYPCISVIENASKLGFELEKTKVEEYYKKYNEDIDKRINEFQEKINNLVKSKK